jgi:hypothetical protein
MIKIVNLIKFKKSNFSKTKLKKKQSFFKKEKDQQKKNLNQENLLQIFNKLIEKKKSLNNFKKQKKILYLLDNQEFNKNLDIFIISNFLSINFKNFLKFNRRIFLLKLNKLQNKKKKKKFLKKKFLKKKLNNYLKFLLLNNYSLINKIKKKDLNFFLKNKKNKKYLLFINIRSNNIFINLFCFKKNKLQLIKFWSCGIFKLHCTKRKLKFIIYTMLKEIKKKIKYLSFFIIKIFCSKFLHKFLYRNFKKLFFRSTFIIFNSFKIFNGCRSKKKRRKKHLKFRVLR